MTTSWTLPVSSIIRDALELIGVVADGETVSANDQALCLTALQNILKELPLHGLSWNKITAPPAALAWSSLTPSVVNMPSGYFGSPAISYTANSVDVDLEIITKEQYDAIQQPAYVALYPQKIYISPANVGYLWPVPSADPVMTITYQAIVSDAVAASAPDVIQAWLGGLGTWLAYEILPKYNPPADVRRDITERYLEKKRLMLASAAETAPICFGVAD